MTRARWIAAAACALALLALDALLPRVLNPYYATIVIRIGRF